MPEIDDAFNALMFGSGAWIGFLLIAGIIILITYRVKESSLIFMPVSAIFGVLYLRNVAVSSMFMWAAVFMFCLPIYLMVRLIKK